MNDMSEISGGEGEGPLTMIQCSSVERLTFDISRDVNNCRNCLCRPVATPNYYPSGRLATLQYCNGHLHSIIWSPYGFWGWPIVLFGVCGAGQINITVWCSLGARLTRHVNKVLSGIKVQNQF